MNRTLWIALSLLLTVAGCATGTSAAAPKGGSDSSSPTPSEATNAIAFSGPTLGTGELKTNTCLSGGRLNFRGADAADQNTKEILVVRLVIDPIDGPAVRLFRDSEESERSLVLRKSDCSTFDYVLEGTGSVVNLVEEIKFGLHLDCRGPKGDRVVGNVDLPACL